MSMVWTMTVFFFGFICGMVFLRLLTSWGEGSPVPRADVKREEKGKVIPRISKTGITYSMTYPLS